MNPLLICFVIIVRIAIVITKAVEKETRQRRQTPVTVKRRRNMKLTLFKTQLSYAANLFNGHFVDVKVFYTARFNTVPCVSFIGEIDITKAYDIVRNYCVNDIVDTHQHSYFNHDAQKVFFNNTVIVLSKKRMIEIAGNYCQILHTPDGYDWARWLLKELAVCRAEAQPAQSTAYTKVLGFAGAADLN